MKHHWLGPGVIGRIHRDGKLVALRMIDGSEVSVRSKDGLSESTEECEDSSRQNAQSTQPRKYDMTEATEKTPRTLKAFNMEAAAEQRLPAAGTKRFIAHQLIARPEGATIEEVMAATGWNRRNSAEGIRLLNKHNGLGLKQDEAGRIRIV